MSQQSTSANKSSGLVITIDGPAGAGKSTVARQLADRLGFEFLDTGAMYRCVTLAVQRQGIVAADAVARLAEQLHIVLDGAQVLMDEEDVSQAIRRPEVTESIGLVADNLDVRRLLTQRQRKWALGRCVVTEGRDQGSEVFRDSPCKIYLVASREERAKRRLNDLKQRGIEQDYATVLQQQSQRDVEDESRSVGALRKAEDAIEVCTDGQALDSVVQTLELVVRERLERLHFDLNKCNMNSAVVNNGKLQP